MTLLLSILCILCITMLVAGGAALAVWSVVRGESRASGMLEDWLRDNEFQLRSKSTPWIKDNPFFMSSNRGQKVFKVTVRDKQGQLRQGWIRCGHALAGVAIDQVEVKWDKTFVAEADSEPRDRVIAPP